MKSKTFYLIISTLISSFFACDKPEVGQLNKFCNIGTEIQNADHTAIKLRKYIQGLKIEFLGFLFFGRTVSEINNTRGFDHKTPWEMWSPEKEGNGDPFFYLENKKNNLDINNLLDAIITSNPNAKKISDLDEVTRSKIDAYRKTLLKLKLEVEKHTSAYPINNKQRTNLFTASLIFLKNLAPNENSEIKPKFLDLLDFVRKACINYLFNYNEASNQEIKSILSSLKNIKISNELISILIEMLEKTISMVEGILSGYDENLCIEKREIVARFIGKYDSFLTQFDALFYTLFNKIKNGESTSLNELFFNGLSFTKEKNYSIAKNRIIEMIKGVISFIEGSEFDESIFSTQRPKLSFSDSTAIENLLKSIEEILSQNQDLQAAIANFNFTTAQINAISNYLENDEIKSDVIKDFFKEKDKVILPLKTINAISSTLNRLDLWKKASDQIYKNTNSRKEVEKLKKAFPAFRNVINNSFLSGIGHDMMRMNQFETEIPKKNQKLIPLLATIHISGDTGSIKNSMQGDDLYMRLSSCEGFFSDASQKDREILINSYKTFHDFIALNPGSMQYERFFRNPSSYRKSRLFAATSKEKTLEDYLEGNTISIKDLDGLIGILDQVKTKLKEENMEDFETPIKENEEVIAAIRKKISDISNILRDSFAFENQLINITNNNIVNNDIANIIKALALGDHLKLSKDQLELVKNVLSKIEVPLPTPGVRYRGGQM